MLVILLDSITSFHNEIVNMVSNISGKKNKKKTEEVFCTKDISRENLLWISNQNILIILDSHANS